MSSYDREPGNLWSLRRVCSFFQVAAMKSIGSWHVRGFVALTVLLGCDQRDIPVLTEAPSSIAALVEIGTDETADPNAVFARPLDAAFFDGGVAVVDASPPYVRLFAEDGTFVGAAGRRGRGPGELTRPLGISKVGDQLIVVEADRWVLLDTHGRPTHTETQRNRTLRGVARACGSGFVVLFGERGKFEPPATVTIAHSGGLYEDTVAVLGSLRSNNHRVHPFFASASDSTVVLYAEAMDDHTLILFDCNSGDTRRISIEPVGRQEYFEPTGPNSHALHPAGPPQPAGIAQYRGDIFWLVNDQVGETAEDKITVVTRIASTVPERVALRGWYQLVDHTADRWLLLTHEPTPRILVVDPAMLLEGALPLSVGRSNAGLN